MQHKKHDKISKNIEEELSLLLFPVGADRSPLAEGEPSRAMKGSRRLSWESLLLLGADEEPAAGCLATGGALPAVPELPDRGNCPERLTLLELAFESQKSTCPVVCKSLLLISSLIREE